MDDVDSGNADFDAPVIPGALRDACARLERAGCEAWLVGPAMRALLTGSRPQVYHLATNASFDTVLDVFPRAVAIGPARDTACVPTSAGPIDVLALSGRGVESLLEDSDFTFHAVAYEPRSGRVIDSYGGASDATAGRIRAVGSATACVRDDPVRSLRAVRLAAEHGLEIDPELLAALGEAVPHLRRIPAIRVRTELTAILLSPSAAMGLEILERCGITAEITARATPGRFAWVEHLPLDLDLRLAAWIGNGRVRRTLHRIRYSPPVVARTELLARLHPIDSNVDPTRMAAIARFARRVGFRDAHALLALRRAELRVTGDEATMGVLTQLEEALEHLRKEQDAAGHRTELALTGADVMKILECGPGPRIGRALAHLTRCITRDPELNRPDALRELLLDWEGPEEP